MRNSATDKRRVHPLGCFYPLVKWLDSKTPALYIAPVFNLQGSRSCGAITAVLLAMTSSRQYHTRNCVCSTNLDFLVYLHQASRFFVLPPFLCPSFSH